MIILYVNKPSEVTQNLRGTLPGSLKIGVIGRTSGGKVLNYTTHRIHYTHRY